MSLFVSHSHFIVSPTIITTIMFTLIYIFVRCDKQLKKSLTKRSAKTELVTPDTQNRIPLVTAIQKNQPMMVDEILAFYKENNIDINIRDSHGNTALHCACQEPVLDERIITGLLKFPGVDVCAQNLDGNTPLHLWGETVASPGGRAGGGVAVGRGGGGARARGQGPAPAAPVGRIPAGEGRCGRRFSSFPPYTARSWPVDSPWVCPPILVGCGSLSV